jgi:hypothetical protein
MIRKYIGDFLRLTGLHGSKKHYQGEENLNTQMSPGQSLFPLAGAPSYWCSKVETSHRLEHNPSSTNLCFPHKLWPQKVTLYELSCGKFVKHVVEEL